MPTSKAHIQDSDVDLDIAITPPERKKIMEANKSIKNKKDPAQDKTASQPQTLKKPVTVSIDGL